MHNEGETIQMSCNFLLLNAKVSDAYVYVHVRVCVCVYVYVGAEVGGKRENALKAFVHGLLAHTKRLILQTTERERVKAKLT